jgi:hypothetical protein
MDLGFETIGNATLICYDGGPVLATDPWLDGATYFGSWILSHEIPAAQREAIRDCKYLWISHGHPDHLSMDSLEGLRDKEILIPDHYGGRIRKSLEEAGFRVRVLKDGEWTQLSPRMRVCSIGDVCQDAVLLVDLGGRLIVDANDASDRGAGNFLRETLQRFETSYLLCLTGGDADLINFFDEDGKRITPAAANQQDLGPGIAGLLDYYGIRYFVPFSSMHRYARKDSSWANSCTTPLGAHQKGFAREGKAVLPPFARCVFHDGREEVSGLNPKPAPEILRAPEEFGDSWSDPLEKDDVAELAKYFRSNAHLSTFLGFINFRVGGKDHVIDINREHFARGLTFETPRASLMTVVRYQVFDDLLIANFTRATANGDWGGRRGNEVLYPDFAPFVAKFGDNGGARSAEELRAYFRAYQERGFFGFLPTPEAQALRGAIARYADV